jgi:hypothetical protein
VHTPTYNQKKKWEASEGFKASHGSKGKDGGKTRSMHDKYGEHEANMTMVKTCWPIGVMIMVVMEMMNCSLLLCYNYKHGHGRIMEVAMWQWKH